MPPQRDRDITKTKIATTSFHPFDPLLFVSLDLGMRNHGRAIRQDLVHAHQSWLLHLPSAIDFTAIMGRTLITPSHLLQQVTMG